MSEMALRTLIERRLCAIANQPGIQDFGIPFDARFIDDLVEQYTRTPI